VSRIKKIINDPEDIVRELIDGAVLASHGALRKAEGVNALVRAEIPNGKVALLIGGGSGHEPMYSFYVGEGLADVSACGNIFAAPSPDTVYAATAAAHRGSGVLYVYGNYAGDVMNFAMGAELAEADGIEVRTVLVADDVAVEKPEDRRGIGGAFYMVKVAGAACARAKTLAEAEATVRKAQTAIRTIGVAVRAGSLPETGEPTFELGDEEIEIGMGAHGEPGVERRKLMPADALTESMIARVVDDLPFRRGDRVALLLNDLGATTMMELMIVNRRARALLAERGIEVVRSDIGPFLTCQEMAGFSITLMRLDDELEACLAAPCRSLAYSQA
jgi:phosphoenolpyruvate---glycerone phosphotransferase subunit DhaK